MEQKVNQDIKKLDDGTFAVVTTTEEKGLTIEQLKEMFGRYSQEQFQTHNMVGVWRHRLLDAETDHESFIKKSIDGLKEQVRIYEEREILLNDILSKLKEQIESNVEQDIQGTTSGEGSTENP